MNRLQKKCFIGSVALHGLLFGVLLIASAFDLGRKPEPLPPVITIVSDAKLTDSATRGGGNPAGQPQPPAPKPIPDLPKPPEPKAHVEPEQPKPPVKPAELAKPKETPVKPVIPDRTQTRPKETAVAKKPLIETNLVRRPRNPAEDPAVIAKNRADIAAADRLAKLQAQRRADQINGIVGHLGDSLNKSTIDVQAGPGGVAFANYGDKIGQIYRRAVDANHPQSDENVNAAVRIVVARDGTVLRSELTGRTGNSLLDKVVERAIKSVRSLPEFPAEAKDSERTFNLTLAFEARRISA